MRSRRISGFSAVTAGLCFLVIATFLYGEDRPAHADPGANITALAERIVRIHGSNEAPGSCGIPASNNAMLARALQAVEQYATGRLERVLEAIVYRTGVWQAAGPDISVGPSQIRRSTLLKLPTRHQREDLLSRCGALRVAVAILNHLDDTGTQDSGMRELIRAYNGQQTATAENAIHVEIVMQVYWSLRMRA